MEEIRENAVYNYRQAQKFLGVGERTISKLIARGEISVRTVGTKYRFLGSEILRYLKSK